MARDSRANGEICQENPEDGRSNVVQPPSQDAVAYDVRPGSQTELLGGARLVGFCGLDAERESAGNLFVAETQSDQLDYFGLSVAERPVS